MAESGDWHVPRWALATGGAVGALTLGALLVSQSGNADNMEHFPFFRAAVTDPSETPSPTQALVPLDPRQECDPTLPPDQSGVACAQVTNPGGAELYEIPGAVDGAFELLADGTTIKVACATLYPGMTDYMFRTHIDSAVPMAYLDAGDLAPGVRKQLEEC